MVARERMHRQKASVLFFRGSGGLSFALRAAGGWLIRNEYDQYLSSFIWFPIMPWAMGRSHDDSSKTQGIHAERVLNICICELGHRARIRGGIERLRRTLMGMMARRARSLWAGFY